TACDARAPTSHPRIDRRATECEKLSASEAPDPGRHHVGTPGDIISECPGDFVGIRTFAPNWHIEAIAFALMRVLRGEIKRLIITVPPRSLKSICASVAFPAFVLGHDPTRRIICVSYAEALARTHANDWRELLRSTTIACSRTPGSAMPKTP